ncbi:Lissencephaly-1 [Catenaria anguillulae PL171]|uniref:Nuclear distribution protein PAC1 n=1 Tax=Catenaria anguillulae PL171 TaxID=765915 RepID=A0A1Y2HU06_9FUNG|nr:Lissencephaly-1 [Catenaria anguillulae PL171]
MSILTSKQGDELRRAVLEYLVANGLTATATTFHQEAQLPADALPPSASTPAGASTLEKKWTSIVRLQRKIMDLESRVSQLTDEVASSAGSRPNSKSSADVLPRAPARFELTGHRMPITAVAFHPSYSLLATASEDASVKLWDPESGEFDKTLKGHTKAVTHVAFDGRGALLATCSADLSIKLWDVANDYANTKTLYGHDHSVSSVAFLPPNNTVLVSASRDKTVKFWDLANGYCTRTIVGHDDWVRMAVPSADGRWLATCSNDQTARVWTVASGECRGEMRGHEHVVECVAWVPVEAYEAVVRLLAESATTNGSSGKKYSSEPGQFLVTGSRDKEIKLWDAGSGQCLYTFRGHDNWVRALIFHPSGKYLLSASDDKTVRCWDMSSGRCVKTLEAHGHFVTALAWSPRTQTVATGSVESCAKIWDCK